MHLFHSQNTVYAMQSVLIVKYTRYTIKSQQRVYRNVILNQMKIFLIHKYVWYNARAAYVYVTYSGKVMFKIEFCRTQFGNIHTIVWQDLCILFVNFSQSKIPRKFWKNLLQRHDIRTQFFIYHSIIIKRYNLLLRTYLFTYVLTSAV